MTRNEFEQDKQRRIKGVQAKIEMVRDGTMMHALDLELKLIKRRTFEMSNQDSRFIVNTE